MKHLYLIILLSISTFSFCQQDSSGRIPIHYQENHFLNIIDSLPSKLNHSSDSVLSVTIPDSIWKSISFPRSSLEAFNPGKFIISSFIFESAYTPKGARKDISNGKPVILFGGGFGGTPDFNSTADKDFQRKYGVEFYSQGCIRMPDDDQEGYNQVIFAYLDKKYGTAWRHELRADAIGFEKPEPLDLVDPESSLQVVRVPNPTPNFHPVLGNDQNVRTQFLIIKIAAVGIVILLIGFFLFRRRKRKF